MTGLMVHRPLDHIGFIIDCLKQLRQTEDLSWDTFIRDDFADRASLGNRSRPGSTSFREERPPSIRKSATLPPARAQKLSPNGPTLGPDKRSSGKSYSRQRQVASSTVKKGREGNGIMPATRSVVFVLGLCSTCVRTCMCMCVPMREFLCVYICMCISMWGCTPMEVCVN